MRAESGDFYQYIRSIPENSNSYGKFVPIMCLPAHIHLNQICDDSLTLKRISKHEFIEVESLLTVLSCFEMVEQIRFSEIFDSLFIPELICK